MLSSRHRTRCAPYHLDCSNPARSPAGGAPTGFMDDALRLERVLHDYSPPWLEPFFATSTSGSVALHINSNEHTDAEDTRAWMYFDTKWMDDRCGGVSSLARLFQLPPEDASSWLPFSLPLYSPSLC